MAKLIPKFQQGKSFPTKLTAVDNTQMNTPAIQKYFQVTKNIDSKALEPLKFDDKYKESQHTYKYRTDESYNSTLKKYNAERVKAGIGETVSIPSTNINSSQYIGNPNLMFIRNGTVKGESIRERESTFNDIISAALPNVPVAAIQNAKHPLIYSLKNLSTMDDVKDYGKSLILAGLDKLPKSLIKSPIIKELAYRAGSRFGGQPSVSTKVLSRKNLLKDSEISYDGSWNYDPDYYGADDYPSNSVLDPTSKRNVLRNYIFQEDQGFTKSNIPVQGLDKYYERYGDIKAYLAKPFNAKKVYGDEDIVNTFPRDLQEWYAANPKKAMKWIGQQANTEEGFRYSSTRNTDIMDNIAGHQSIIKIDKTTSRFQPKLIVQDIWKFTPEDYRKRWLSYKTGFLDQETGKAIKDLDLYARLKQISLMDKVGKPIILNYEFPIKSKLVKLNNRNEYLKRYLDKNNKPAVFSIGDLLK